MLALVQPRTTVRVAPGTSFSAKYEIESFIHSPPDKAGPWVQGGWCGQHRTVSFVPRVRLVVRCRASPRRRRMSEGVHKPKR